MLIGYSSIEDPTTLVTRAFDWFRVSSSEVHPQTPGDGVPIKYRSQHPQRSEVLLFPISSVSSPRADAVPPRDQGSPEMEGRVPELGNPVLNTCHARRPPVSVRGPTFVARSSNGFFTTAPAR